VSCSSTTRHHAQDAARGADARARHRGGGRSRERHEAVSEVDRLSSDVLLMDVRMPDLDGVQAAKAVMLQRPSTKIVALTWSDDPATVWDMISAGAIGYVVKSGTIEERHTATAITVISGALQMLRAPASGRQRRTWCRTRSGGSTSWSPVGGPGARGNGSPRRERGVPSGGPAGRHRAAGNGAGLPGRRGRGRLARRSASGEFSAFYQDDMSNTRARTGSASGCSWLRGSACPPAER
jgi:CheY-like chemotaxis protein